MSFDRLGLWIGERAKSLRHPRAMSLSMLDGAAAAVVAGPVSMMPEEWVCQLRGVDPDDFNHDTETFSAIAATLTRHNATVNALSTKPEALNPYSCARQTARSTRGPGAWLLRGHQAAAARMVPIDEPERYRARTAASDIVPLRRPFRSPGSRTPTGAVWMLRPSLTSRGATFRRSLKPSASSGCRAGSPGLHSRRSSPGRHAHASTAGLTLKMGLTTRMNHAPVLHAEPVRPGHIPSSRPALSKGIHMPLTFGLFRPTDAKLHGNTP